MSRHVCKRFRSLGHMKSLMAKLSIETAATVYLHRLEDALYLECIHCHKNFWCPRAELTPVSGGKRDQFETIDRMPTLFGGPR